MTAHGSVLLAVCLLPPHRLVPHSEQNLAGAANLDPQFPQKRAGETSCEADVPEAIPVTERRPAVRVEAVPVR